MLPPLPPVKAGWKGHEGQSWGAETTGRKRKRDRQSWRCHRGEVGERLSDAHTGREGGGCSCGVYQPPPAHTVPGPMSHRLHPALLSGLAALPATAPVGTPSAAVCCLIFLPAPDRTEEGDGKQLPCPATTPALWAAAAPGWLRAQALQTDRLGSFPPL